VESYRFINVKLRSIVLSFILLFTTATSLASPSKNTDDTLFCYVEEKQILAHYVKYLRDPKQSTTLQQFKDIPHDQLDGINDDIINFGKTNDELWFSLPVSNCSITSQDLLLTFNIVRAGTLEVYLEHNDKVETLFDSDILGSTIKNIDKYKKLSFRYQLEPGQEKRFLIRFIGANMTFLPLEIKDSFEQSFDLLPIQNSLIAIITCIFTLIVFNALLFVFTRLKMFLFYVAVELISLLYLAHIIGWTTIYLWGDGPWDQLAAVLIGSSMTTMMVVFSRAYFETKKYSPALDLILKFLVYVGVIFLIVKSSTYYIHYWPSSTINDFGYYVGYPSVFMSILTAFTFTFIKKNQNKYEYLTNILILLAWFILTLNVFMHGLRVQNILMFDVMSDVHFGIGVLISAIIISIALSIRIKATVVEKETSLLEVTQLQAAQLIQQQREQELLQQKTLSEQSATEAGKLILAVGHDGRQMLSALTNYANVLSAIVKEKKTKKIAFNIKTITQILSDIMNNALSIADRSNNMNEAEFVSFSMNSINEPLKLIYQQQANLKGLKIIFSPSKVQLYSDRTILIRILGNLISNAIKSTHEGKILIAARKRAGKNVIQVWDTGVGIAAHKLDSIFHGDVSMAKNIDPFTSSDLGIGLKSSANMAKIINAELKVYSKINQGTLMEIHFN
jgi:signal transduction histidine kinase